MRGVSLAKTSLIATTHVNPQLELMLLEPAAAFFLNKFFIDFRRCSLQTTADPGKHEGFTESGEKTTFGDE